MNSPFRKSRSAKTPLPLRPASCTATSPITTDLAAGEVDPAALREVDRLVVSGVGVTHHAGSRVGREDATKLLATESSSVCDRDHPGVDRIPYPDSTTVMHRDPRRAGRRVHERVEDRPVRDRVAAVLHTLGLAVGRGDGARIEVVAADDDRRSEVATLDELVDPLAEQRALAVTEPAHPRGKTLERHAALRQADPARQRLVLGKELEHEAVGAMDVRRVSGKRDPPEGSTALGEERTDVFGNEAWIAEGAREAGLFCLASQVIAVVERDGAAAGERDDRRA